MSDRQEMEGEASAAGEDENATRRGEALRPQIYLDPRPAERFDRYHEWARTHAPDWVQDLLRLVMLPASMVLYRVSCRDCARVPGAGAAIIAPNHFSAMDHFFCGIYLR